MNLHKQWHNNWLVLQMTVFLLLPCPCSIIGHRSRVSDSRRIVVIRSRLMPTNVSAYTMRRSEAEWKPDILYLDAQSDWTVISQTLDGSYLFGINQWPSADMVCFCFPFRVYSILALLSWKAADLFAVWQGLSYTHVDLRWQWSFSVIS